MRMLGSIVDVDVAQELGAQLVLGEHAFQHFVEQTLRTLGLQTFGAHFALAAGITRKGQVYAVGPFVARHFHLVGVDDDDVVATINVRSEVGFVFAAGQFGHFRTQTTQNLVGSINNDPFLGCRVLVDGYGCVT